MKKKNIEKILEVRGGGGRSAEFLSSTKVKFSRSEITGKKCKGKRVWLGRFPLFGERGEGYHSLVLNV